MLASHHLLLGHGMIVKEIRADNAALDLGLTLNLTYAQPLNPRSLADQRAAVLVDGQLNRWFLDPLFRGTYPEDITEEFAEIDPAGYGRFEDAIRPGDMDLISQPLDALGINYYQGDIVAGSDRVEGELAEKLGTTHLRPGPTMAPGTTRRYKPGGAILAKRAGVPVVPIAHNAGEFWKRNAFIKRPGEIVVSIGPVITVKGEKAEVEVAEARKVWQFQSDLSVSRSDPRGRIVSVRSLRRVR